MANVARLRPRRDLGGHRSDESQPALRLRRSQHPGRHLCDEQPAGRRELYVDEACYSARRAGSPLAFTASSGVFVSTNGGQSWQDRSHNGMRYWTKDVVIDPHDPNQNTWYAAVFSGWGGAPNGLGGLYRTTNRGVNW